MDSDEQQESACRALFICMATTLAHHEWHILKNPEFLLWQQLFDEKPIVAPETVRLLQNESRAAGGWWTWPDGEGITGKPLFLDFEAWDEVRARANVL